jgi:DNA primase
LGYASPVIGQETLDRVRRETKVVELIGETVKLQRRGRSYVGLCPFHKEKTPSFHVNAERGFYHCFGCHESGDAIKFVQRVEGLEFQEAVRQLAERAGIEIVDTLSDPERKQQAEARKRQGELYDIGAAAAGYFERMLREHPLRAHALAELERRGLVPSTPTDAIADALQAFRIGYAPYGWDGLVKQLRESGFGLGAAEKVGLLAPRKSGTGFYDRFRHRLMFAVIDVQGRVVAFSGRALAEPPADELRELGLEAMSSTPGEAPAKYVNSSESPVYRKREAVFGLYQARQALRNGEPCVLVEGNFDVVSLHARGIKNVVAPLGTAFTPEQAHLIRRYCSDVTLLFDGDGAGRKAARGARDACTAAGLTAKVASLPDGVDPDDLARSGGPEAVSRVISAARGMLEYLIDTVLDGGFSADDAQARVTKIREVAELLASESDPTLRSLAEGHADRIAERLGIADARTFRALAATVKRALAGGAAPNQAAVRRPEPPHRARSRDRREEIGLSILGALLDYPELLDMPDGLELNDLLDGDLAGALAALRQEWNGQMLRNPEVVLAKLSPSIHPFALARLAAPRHERLEDARVELSLNVKKLRSLELTRHKSEVLEEIERARQLGDFEKEAILLKQLFEKRRAANDRERA